MLAAAAAPRDARLGRDALFAYGLLGAPLAMAALPLYVHLPRFYGDHLGVGLAALGVLLLVLRLADGLLDPLLGAWSDRMRSRRSLVALAVPVLAAGMVALFMPPVRGDAALLAWLAGSLFVVYLAFSLATINPGAWGAELSDDPVERTRITAVREALALAGVVVASLAPGVLGGDGGDDAGLPKFALLFAALALACLAVAYAAPPGRRAMPSPRPLFSGLLEPLRDRLFRSLLAVFVANGIASAIPATLVLFFVADVLDAQESQGLFLALYFVAGAAGMPLWVKLSARIGKVRAWGIAMVAAMAAFVWAALLGPGDTTAFAAICVLSGLALGADLALPPSILADVVGRGGRPASTGAYFGIWTLATKLNLALAAGIALPLLAALGYAPGGGEPAALRALGLVYAALPCVLKLLAACALAWFAARAAGALR
ncbi:MAG TPA: MFS transporter [Casimicrobiaceae bacterium]|nr:MFS transporter [Casimicrobiaceae bacterium]